MAVLEKLRSRGALVSTIIGIALLSFVVGDFFTGSRFGSIFNSNDVGEIAGTSISYDEYNSQQEYFQNIYTAMGRSTQSEAQTEEIREQAWYALVQEYAINPEYAALGLAVSKDELYDLVAGSNPAPLALRYFSDPNTGAYNRAGVIQYLQELDANPSPEAKTTWLYMEKEIAHQRVQTKLLALLGKSLYTTSLEAKEAMENTANTVNIEYVVRNYTDLPDSTVSISSSDLKKYYKQNIRRYEQQENCDVEYVNLPILPSPADNAAVKEWIENLAPQFAESKDVRLFAAQNSDEGYNDTYYKKDELEGSIAEFAFSKSTADILPPFEENGIYKMARIADIRMLPDSVQARHILVTARNTMDETRLLADSIKKAIQRGGSFAALSEQYSADEAAKQKGGDLGWFAQKTMVKPFGDSCFFAPKGHVMIVETNYGIHVVQVTDKSNVQKKVQLAIVSREVMPSKETRANLFAQMNDIASRSSSRQAFVDAAAEKNLAPRTASRITINDKDVHSLRNARELVRWAWNAKQGAVSPVFEIDDNFVIAALSLRRKYGYAPLEQVKTEVTSAVLQQKKGDILLSEVQDKDVAAAASDFNLTPHTAEGITFGSFYITGIGVEPKLAGAVTGTPQGQGGAVAGSTGVYVYKITAEQKQTAADEAAIAAEKQRIQRNASQRAGYEVLNVLRTFAKIKDRRGEVMY